MASALDNPWTPMKNKAPKPFALQARHTAAVRHVASALDNALTNVPLVNGAMLGGGRWGGSGGAVPTHDLDLLRQALGDGLSTLRPCR